MDMLRAHRDALETLNPHYHDFLLRYRASAHVVYGFVEGKEDPCYYRGFIEHSIPADWLVELWPAGRKRTVYKIHSSMDWGRFPKKRVCFFVDRDLDDLVPRQRVTDVNIYCTDGYSIENSLVNRNTCSRVLTELYGFAQVRHTELDTVCDLFEQQYEHFLSAMMGVMAWLLLWTRSGHTPQYSNIKMNELFSVFRGTLHHEARPGGFSTLAEYLHSRCQVSVSETADVGPVEGELRQRNEYRNLVRGKFVLWFLLAFCTAVHANARAFLPSQTMAPKIAFGNIAETNAMAAMAVRGRIPDTLRRFLSETFADYVNAHHTSTDTVADEE